MIENLNTLTFKDFGKIVYKGYSHAVALLQCNNLSVSEADINSKTVDKLYMVPDAPVIIDISDGIGILCVSDNPGTSITKVFLLDKTVLINPGIYFGISSLYGSCKVKYAFKSSKVANEVPAPSLPDPVELHPRFEIMGIHTLFYQEKEMGFIFKGEKHNFWELTYVDSGTMYTIVDGTGVKVNQGEAIFYKPDAYHIQWADEKECVCFVTITFDMQFSEVELLTGSKFQLDAGMKELIQQILSEKNQNSYYSADVILCCLKEFIIRYVRNAKLEKTISQQGTAVKGKIENSIVMRCIDYIQKHLGARMSISDIADSIPISPSYLSSIFKKYMEITIVDYINRQRLEKSKELIRSSEYNMTRISEILGYASVHYFSTQFKQHYGISPSQYSKSLKSKI